MKKVLTILIASLFCIGIINAFTIDDKTYTVQDDGTEAKEDQYFTKTITENVGTYNECIQKLTTWQAKVAKQQALCDGMETDKDALPARK